MKQDEGETQEIQVIPVFFHDDYNVEQHNNFPDDPLPDPDYLRQDLASCVTQGGPERQFTEGEKMFGKPEL